MALKRNLLSVDPQLFTSNGTTAGKLTIDRADYFKVHQLVFIKAPSLPTLPLEVKRIVQTAIFVGPIDGDINTRTNISAYETGNGASIFANEQVRPFLQNIKDSLEYALEPDDIEHEEEPVLAKRVVLIDGFGEKIDTIVTAGIRRLAVDTSVSVTTSGVSAPPSTPSVTNISYPTAAVEMSFVLPTDTQKFTIKVRDHANLRLGFSSGNTTSGPYLTIRDGNALFEDNILTESVTLYFQLDKDSQVVEILTWV